MDGATLAPAMLAAVAATGAIAATAPSIDQVRLSPDGERVLATASSTEGVALVTSDLASGQRSVALQPAPKQLLDECGWAADERIVSPFSSSRNGRDPHSPTRAGTCAGAGPGRRQPGTARRPSGPAVQEVGGVAPTPPTPWDDDEHVVADYLPAQPNFALVAAAREAREYRSLYRVDLRDGSAARVARWHAGIVFWRTDHDGRVRLGTGWYPSSCAGSSPTRRASTRSATRRCVRRFWTRPTRALRCW